MTTFPENPNYHLGSEVLISSSTKPDERFLRPNILECPYLSSFLPTKGAIIFPPDQYGFQLPIHPKDEGNVASPFPKRLVFKPQYRLLDLSPSHKLILPALPVNFDVKHQILKPGFEYNISNSLPEFYYEQERLLWEILLDNIVLDYFDKRYIAPVPIFVAKGPRVYVASEHILKLAVSKKFLWQPLEICEHGTSIIKDTAPTFQPDLDKQRGSVIIYQPWKSRMHTLSKEYLAELSATTMSPRRSIERVASFEKESSSENIFFSDKKISDEQKNSMESKPDDSKLSDVQSLRYKESSIEKFQKKF